MKHNILKIFIILLFGLCQIIPSLAAEVKDNGASIYLSPVSGIFYVGNTFNVSVFVNTAGNDINAVRVDLKFDPRYLQVASPTAGKSFISVWVSQPTYSNVTGTITFQGGMPAPGIDTSSGLVSTITFRAIAPGNIVISVLESSQILLNDGQGTDILTSTGRGIYELALSPPEGPQVVSPTHPDQNKWYKNNNSTLKWEREDLVTDFSYSIDKNFGGIPDNVSEGKGNSVSYADLEDGIWYFHVKAQKGDIWGGVSHYILRIDFTPPAAFALNLEPSLTANVIPTQQPIISFITTDALSGIDHYELKNLDLNKANSKETNEEFFIEVASPYRLSLGTGTYGIVVRAFDKAGNWRDSSETINVIPRGKFVISTDGINFWITFLSWRLIILLLVLFIIVILIVIFLLQKYHLKVHLDRKRLQKTKEKVENHKDRIKGKYEFQ